MLYNITLLKNHHYITKDSNHSIGRHSTKNPFVLKMPSILTGNK
jgi:hypothetical protein